MGVKFWLDRSDPLPLDIGVHLDTSESNLDFRVVVEKATVFLSSARPEALRITLHRLEGLLYAGNAAGQSPGDPFRPLHLTFARLGYNR